MSANEKTVTLTASDIAALVAKAISDARPTRATKRGAAPVAPIGPETEKERALRESGMSPGFPRRAILEKLLDKGIGTHSVSELQRELGINTAATFRARANNCNWMCNKYPRTGYTVEVSEDGDSVSLVRTSAPEGALKTKEQIEAAAKRMEKKGASAPRKAAQKAKKKVSLVSPAAPQIAESNSPKSE